MSKSKMPTLLSPWADRPWADLIFHFQHVSSPHKCNLVRNDFFPGTMRYLVKREHLQRDIIKGGINSTVPPPMDSVFPCLTPNIFLHGG